MGKNRITELSEFGQSVWLDYISRPLIESGKLKEMIDNGLRGLTSNPSIFDKAITSSNDYDGKISGLLDENRSTFEIYDELTVGDVCDAADIFKPVYEKTQGLDGYVSLEVSPKLAFDINKTIEEGKRLYEKVNRLNVMFKVPSTEEGIKAVEELIASGINVNVTLIFSREQYVKTANAYINGIKQLIARGGDPGRIRSVASVFVSRIDTLIDKSLDQLIERDPQKKELVEALKGIAAVSNSMLIYNKFLEIFSSRDFKELENKGAHLQRVLWGSTSAKNPAYSDIKYVTELIAKDTVNTMPEPTLKAFLDHGVVGEAAVSDVDGSKGIINSLGEQGIDIDTVCNKLLLDGTAAFVKSFDSLMDSIEKKKKNVCKA